MSEDLAALRHALAMLAKPAHRQRRHAEVLRAAARAHFEDDPPRASSLISNLIHTRRVSAAVRGAIDALDESLARLYESQGIEAFQHHGVMTLSEWDVIRARARAVLSLLERQQTP